MERYPEEWMEGTLAVHWTESQYLLHTKSSKGNPKQQTIQSINEQMKWEVFKMKGKRPIHV